LGVLWCTAHGIVRVRYWSSVAGVANAIATAAVASMARYALARLRTQLITLPVGMKEYCTTSRKSAPIAVSHFVWDSARCAFTRFIARGGWFKR
jgi:hypothetical protein